MASIRYRQILYLIFELFGGGFRAFLIRSWIRVTDSNGRFVMFTREDTGADIVRVVLNRLFGRTSSCIVYPFSFGSSSD